MAGRTQLARLGMLRRENRGHPMGPRRLRLPKWSLPHDWSVHLVIERQRIPAFVYGPCAQS